MRWFVFGLALAACPARVENSASDASSTTDAGPEAGALEPGDAGAVDAGPARLRYRLQFHFIDGGVAESSDETAPPTALPPLRALTFSSTEQLQDVRLRTLDWTEAVVPSDDRLSSTPEAGFSYEMAFLQPLKTGRAYVLLIDSESHDVFTTSSGLSVSDLTVPFKISGEREADPKKPKKHKSKKR